MKLSSRFLILILSCILVFCRTPLRSELGNQAYKWTEELTDLGPRASGTPGIQKARIWIEQKVQSMGFTIQKRPFVAKTPKGFIPMKNLSYIIPGANHKARVVLLAHYDSKLFTDIKFVGANDAASSVALLLVLSPQIQKLQLPFDVQIAFVDGEEAMVEWNFNDSLYGSRQMVQDIQTPTAIKGVIVVDMVSDKDLMLIRSRGSDDILLKYLEDSLREMNQSKKLDSLWSYVMDDHTPFVEKKIPTLHLMDFTYGGNISPGYLWHTEQDTMKNISADSLALVGEVILRILKKIH